MEPRFPKQVRQESGAAGVGEGSQVGLRPEEGPELGGLPLAQSCKPAVFRGGDVSLQVTATGGLRLDEVTGIGRGGAGAAGRRGLLEGDRGATRRL